MGFDITKLDEKIAVAEAETKRLQDAKRLLADPKMRKLLADCLTPQADDAFSLSPQTAKPVFSRPSTTGRSGLKATVLRTVKRFGDQPFSLVEVYDAMVADGFEFKSARPRVAVGIELRKLEGKELERISAGSGSTPSTFKNREVAAT